MNRRGGKVYSFLQIDDNLQFIEVAYMSNPFFWII